jgi:hypothetical protein
MVNVLGRLQEQQCELRIRQYEAGAATGHLRQPVGEETGQTEVRAADRAKEADENGRGRSAPKAAGACRNWLFALHGGRIEPVPTAPGFKA